MQTFRVLSALLCYPSRDLCDALDEMSDLRVMGRFGRVTICSGDGIFAPALATLARAGIETTVVSMPEALSAALRMAAQRLVTVTAPPKTTIPPMAALKEVG